MILINSKRKEFPISEFGNIHELNKYYIKEVLLFKDSKEFKNTVSKFSKLVEEFYYLIQDIKRYNNNQNNNNNNNQ